MNNALKHPHMEPQAVTLALTSRCNIRCPSCYQDQSIEDMPTKEILALIDQLAMVNLKTLLLSGGEPFLRKDLFEILAYAKKKGMETYVATNGVLINQEIINQLENVGLKHMSLSLNGYSAKTNFGRDPHFFDKIIENLKLLSKAKFELFISIVVMKDNYKLLPKIFDYFSSLGIKNFWLNRLNIDFGNSFYKEHSLSETDIIETIKLIETRDKSISIILATPFTCLFYNQTLDWMKKSGIYGCHTCGERACFIDSNGDVYPCSYFHKTKYCAGNARKTPFKEIWQNSPVLALFRNTAPKLKGACGKCDLKEFCGGCRRLAYAVYNDIYAEDPACPKRLKFHEKQ